jgi:hypothetical protein
MSGQNDLVTVGDRPGFFFWRPMGMIYRGWVKVQDGDAAEGNLPPAQRFGGLPRHWGAVVDPYYTAFLARPCEIGGRIEEALAQLDDAFHTVERTGERWFAAEPEREACGQW